MRFAVASTLLAMLCAGCPGSGGDETEVAPYCGDGVINSADEECDDANDSNTDDCLNTCVDASCGDAFVWEGVDDRC